MVEKQKSTIQEMFTSISGTYDKINGVLSFGWYKLWYNLLKAELFKENMS